MGIDTETGLTVLTIGDAGKRVQTRLIFGAPVRRILGDRGSSVCVFSAGQVFGFVARKAGDARGHSERVFVVLCGRPGEELSVLPAVRPGAHILVSAAGPVQVPRVVGMLASLSERCDLTAFPAEKWRVLGTRLVTGFPVELDAFVR